jgi:undecaprenyl-diphosphatase
MDWVVDSLVALSDRLYLVLNGLSGRSWLFDTLVALAVDNNLVKAGPVCAAFFFAWYARRDDAAALRARRILLATLCALAAVLAASKIVGNSVFLPRPFILSQHSYHLEGDRLVETPKLAYRTPGAGFSGGRFERLRQGEIEENDLASFPSDHAAFFFALALGTFLAARRAGALALAWTVVVICGSRIVTGTHSPLDIAAGMAIGAAILLLFQFLARRWLARPADAVVGWTARWPAWSAALLFLAMFEVGNTLDNLRDALRTLKQIAERMLGL